MLPRHALSAGRLARLGATRGFTTGWYGTEPGVKAYLARLRPVVPVRHADHPGLDFGSAPSAVTVPRSTTTSSGSPASVWPTVYGRERLLRGRPPPRLRATWPDSTPRPRQRGPRARWRGRRPWLPRSVDCRRTHALTRAFAGGWRADRAARLCDENSGARGCGQASPFGSCGPRGHPSPPLASAAPARRRVRPGRPQARPASTPRSRGSLFQGREKSSHGQGHGRGHVVDHGVIGSRSLYAVPNVSTVHDAA